MPKNFDPIAATRRAIDQAGGVVATADKLALMTGRNLKSHAVAKWMQNGCPARYALWMEYLSGVPIEEIRPDMCPRAVRKQVA